MATISEQMAPQLISSLLFTVPVPFPALVTNRAGTTVTTRNDGPFNPVAAPGQHSGGAGVAARGAAVHRDGVDVEVRYHQFVV